MNQMNKPISTIEQFVKLCKKYKVNGFDDRYLLRKTVKNRKYCPITYLYLKMKKKYLPSALFDKAGEKLNIDQTLINDIANSADTTWSKYSKLLRKHLCK